MKFTIKDFHSKYPDDNACLHEIFLNRYGKLKICPDCKKKTKFHRVNNRKCYACQICAYQIHPLADTIFHKSETSLKSWFFAIFLFSNSKNGVSGKELQRQLGVTYKTAWRMAKQIRMLFKQGKEPLENIVEADETYVGGKAKGKRGRGAEHKTAVFGLVQRQGEVRAEIVPNTKARTILPIMAENVKPGSRLMTDEYGPYNKVRSMGYFHRRINHGIGQYVYGITHVNTIEGFWSQLKRSIHGTYHAVSPKYLQSYVDEFAYRYNNREHDGHFFPLVLSEVAKQVL